MTLPNFLADTSENMSTRSPSLNRVFGSPLFIVAGLARDIGQSAINYVKKDQKCANFQFIPIPGSANGRVYNEQNISDGLRRLSDFVLRKLDNSLPVVNPSRLVLLYVKDDSDEEFLRAFDFFCYAEPIKLNETSNGDQNILRRSPSIVNKQLLKQILEMQEPNSELKELEDEIFAKRKTSFLLLPPDNFLLSGKLSIKELLYKIRRKEHNWRNAPAGLVLKKFNHSDLPRFLGKKQKINAYSDKRNIVFPPCKEDERHALARQITGERQIEEMKIMLNQLYRFGIPITDGFHYDAQKQGLEKMDGVSVKCVKKGDLRCSGSHVNIYPNDYVRE